MATHQLLEETGGFVAKGFICGLAGFMTVGLSGIELDGLSMGFVAEGIGGLLVVGTVVIGFVISLCLVETESFFCSFSVA